MAGLRAEISYDRDGARYYRCPRCGMVFKKSKDFSRHLNKSHRKLLVPKNRNEEKS